MHTEIENEGVQDNAGVQYNTNTPNNDHNDPKNYPIIKIENTTDAIEEEEDENDEVEEAYMGNKEHEDGEDKYK